MGVVVYKQTTLTAPQTVETIVNHLTALGPQFYPPQNPKHHNLLTFQSLKLFLVLKILQHPSSYRKYSKRIKLDSRNSKSNILGKKLISTPILHITNLAKHNITSLSKEDSDQHYVIIHLFAQNQHQCEKITNLRDAPIYFRRTSKAEKFRIIRVDPKSDQGKKNREKYKQTQTIEIRNQEEKNKTKQLLKNAIQELNNQMDYTASTSHNEDGISEHESA